MDNENKKYKLKEEFHLFTSDEKLKYLGYGEWVEECDKITFDYLGYECMVHRMLQQEPCSPSHCFGGHLCGYVRIPNDHVFYGKEYMEVIYCHGGITYNDFNKVSELKNLLPEHRIGFDCAHATDITPSVEKFKKERSPSPRCIDKVEKQLRDLLELMKPTYKNIAFCIEECMSIVDQMIEVEKSALKLERNI
jgi:hypothetical protein